MVTILCVLLQVVTFACMNFAFGKCDENEVDVILTCFVHRDNEHNFIAFILDLMCHSESFHACKTALKSHLFKSTYFWSPPPHLISVYPQHSFLQSDSHWLCLCVHLCVCVCAKSVLFIPGICRWQVFILFDARIFECMLLNIVVIVIIIYSVTLIYAVLCNPPPPPPF